MYRILLIEDDPVIADVIAAELSRWQYDVRRTTDFAWVMEDFHTFDPHLVLLDLTLPFYNGFHWCAEIRKESNAPVVFISSAGDNMNTVTALYQGADDFIAKPFDLSVLVAKIQALLRRAYDFTVEASPVSFGGHLLELRESALYADGDRLELTKNEFRILQVLFDNRGRVVTREEIMRKLWDDESFIDDNTLTVNVNRLRRKLEPAGLDDLIQTQKGAGYYMGE